MSWKKVKISDIFTVARGGSPRPIEKFLTEDKNGINWIMIGDTVSGNKYIEHTAKKIIHEGVKNSRIVNSGDFLLTNSMSFGRPYILKTSGCIHDGWLVLSPKRENLSRDFFYYYLGSDLMKLELSKLASGAVVKNLNKELVSNLSVCLPPLEQQKKIASILDEADAYRQKTKALIAKYDELTQSLFLEMFGDPVKNEKGWELKQLHSLVSKLGDGIHGTPVYSEEGEYYFINGNNLQQGKVVIDANTKRVSETEYLKHKKVLGNTTVLVSINGSIGKVAFYNNEPIILGKSACYFNLIEGSINKTYLYHIIDSPFFIKYASSEATGSTIKNVSLKSMRNFPIPIPSITIQNQFAERVQAIETQKTQAQASLEKAEELFNSLLQRAFKGELV